MGVDPLTTPLFFTGYKLHPSASGIEIKAPAKVLYIAVVVLPSYRLHIKSILQSSNSQWRCELRIQRGKQEVAIYQQTTANF